MKKYLSLVLAAILIIVLGGCSGKAQLDGEFSFSEGLDQNGMWQKVEALKLVELCDHESIKIPTAIHKVADADLSQAVDSLLANYATKNQVTDRAVADGDTLNIDYVGSIDGTEFAGGNTGGQGEEVTLGLTTYIDGFLEQLVGHTPGENFNIDVTFPDDYQNEELSGKDAVFSITINYILETVQPELTDEFVQEKLSDTYGWQTVAEAKDEIRNDIQQDKITTYIEAYIIENSIIESTPDILVEYQKRAIIFHYQDYAERYEIEFTEFINDYVGVSTTEDLLEMHKEDSKETVDFYLVLQAIAEDAGITVTEEDVSTFFNEKMETDDYSEFLEFYGMPYLKLITLHDAITEYLLANAILE